ncbi:hypothetical protein FSP39_009705 [Pinctada imbricata]|uniref:G-protein coupled receptors family 1 profile domain-containing protein n=1 Tax=Pinctada imbricata TaxID=66713 RepID=A0AA89C1E4_PINIB|nr:hypothetical protein FSP39_009705 [Pinctada imbricata]
MLAAIICALPLVGIGKVNRFYPGTWCFIDFASHETGNVVDTYLYAVLGLVIFVTTVTLNVIVVIILIKRVVVVKAKFGKQKTLRNDIYVILFVLSIVVVFSVLWTPLSAHMIQNINSDEPGNGKKEFLVGRLAITNQMVDPWIYIVLRKENFEFLERLYKRFYTMRKEKNDSNSDSMNIDEMNKN